ncbi:MAG: UbiA-like polyprenyltransferase [Gemmatimonadota bacterium]
MNALDSVVTYGRMIRFSHSIFALPFAFSGAALAATRSGMTLAQVGWIALAMVGARSAAMGFNRLVDRHIDAANPRTRQRELPRGSLSPLAVAAFVAASAAALVLAARALNPLCFHLSPLALAAVFAYSYTKRITWASHLVLGACLGLAPLGAWLAVAGSFDLAPVVLALAVTCWVAGFDILYACQDEAFDRQFGLHSIPARLGAAWSLRLARVLHGATVALMLAVGQLLVLGLIYTGGVALIGGLLVYEHWLVRPADLSRVNTAFMTMNSLVSVAYFAFTLADLLL